MNMTFTSDILQLNIILQVDNKFYCNSKENNWVEWKEKFALSISACCDITKAFRKTSDVMFESHLYIEPVRV